MENKAILVRRYESIDGSFKMNVMIEGWSYTTENGTPETAVQEAIAKLAWKQVPQVMTSGMLENGDAVVIVTRGIAL